MVVDGPSPLAVRLDELQPATHSHVVAFKSWTISTYLIEVYSVSSAQTCWRAASSISLSLQLSTTAAFLLKIGVLFLFICF